MEGPRPVIFVSDVAKCMMDACLIAAGKPPTIQMVKDALNTPAAACIVNDLVNVGTRHVKQSGSWGPLYVSTGTQHQDC